MNAIECNNLTKQFGDFKAVNGISLSVKKGEIFGFLGANGAGKTSFGIGGKKGDRFQKFGRNLCRILIEKNDFGSRN